MLDPLIVYILASCMVFLAVGVASGDFSCDAHLQKAGLQRLELPVSNVLSPIARANMAIESAAPTARERA
jgi:hypothetical protein